VSFDIDEFIAKECDARDEFAIPVLAVELAERLRALDPAATSAWLDAKLPRLIAEVIGTREHAMRKRSRRSRRSVFADAAERFEGDGDAEHLSAFAATYVVDPETRLRKRAGDMTGDEHLLVAEAYCEDGKRALFLAAFHRQVAKVAGARPVREVMTEEQYLALYASTATQLHTV